MAQSGRAGLPPIFGTALRGHAAVAKCQGHTERGVRDCRICAASGICVGNLVWSVNPVRKRPMATHARDSQTRAYRDALLAERAQLASEDAASAEDRGTVMLDQQSVGRLSRMDALQRQAMAQATMRRRAARGARIDAALRRIDEGEFGFCQVCGDGIARERLDLDPTVPTCVSCATGA